MFRHVETVPMTDAPTFAPPYTGSVYILTGKIRPGVQIREDKRFLEKQIKSTETRDLYYFAEVCEVFKLKGILAYYFQYLMFDVILVKFRETETI